MANSFGATRPSDDHDESQQGQRNERRARVTPQGMQSAPPTRELFSLRQTQPVLGGDSGSANTQDTIRETIRDIHTTPTLVDLEQIDIAQIATTHLMQPALQQETQRAYAQMADQHDASARHLLRQARQIADNVTAMEAQCNGMTEEYDTLLRSHQRMMLNEAWERHYRWLERSIPLILSDIARYRNQATRLTSRGREHQQAAAQLRLLAQAGL